MQWTAALINLLLPLLFFVSLGFIIYAIILLIRSRIKKSKLLRIRALKVGILPIVYIVGMLSLFKYLSWNYNRKMMPTIAGTYQYSLNDTFQLTYELRRDNTYLIKSPLMTASGTWTIETNTYLITFYDQQKKELTRSMVKMTAARPSLLFLNNKDTIELIKRE